MKIKKLLFILICCYTTAIQAFDVSNGFSVTHFDFPSKYVVARDVFVWLPNGYYANPKQKYATVYMLDGQNLFDANLAYKGQEWQVDEAAAALIAAQKVAPFIVVGIRNLEALRYAEYFPPKVLDFVSNDDPVKQGVLAQNELKGDAFLQFMVQELIPFIESHYRVKANKKYRAIGGSSMGGLMSMYAFFEYPKTFGTALAMSSHWVGVLPEHPYQPLFQGMLDYMQQKLTAKKNTHGRILYFDTGTEQLDVHYPPLQKRVDQLFHHSGHALKAYHSLVFEDAGHEGHDWAERMPQILNKLVLF